MLSTTSEYALRALACMARLPADGTVLSRELSQSLAIPASYLSKILAQMVRVGIVHGSRGVNGGYRLDRPASKIHLIEIVTLFDGPPTQDMCFLGGRKCGEGTDCAADSECGVHKSYSKVRRAHIEFLEHTTVAQVARSTAQSAVRGK